MLQRASDKPIGEGRLADIAGQRDGHAAIATDLRDKGIEFRLPSCRSNDPAAFACKQAGRCPPDA